MYTFTLTTFDKEGQERTVDWQFTPVDREPGFDIYRASKERATGASVARAFWIKEVWQITLGAGTLSFADHRENFLRLLTASKIVWKRSLGSRTIETEFVLETEQRVMMEYLQDRRSLKRKTITLIEKEPNYYDSFDTFYERYLALIAGNALW
jgi:hypothetical protein